MPLFTNPVTINDGTARSFEFIGTNIDKNSDMSATYVESAAAVSDNSRINVKHTRGTRKSRSLVQCTLNKATTGGTVEPIVANLTISYSPNHVQADVEMIIKRIVAAGSVASFPTGVVLGRV